jgi:hypothetical protein
VARDREAVRYAAAGWAQAACYRRDGKIARHNLQELFSLLGASDGCMGGRNVALLGKKLMAESIVNIPEEMMARIQRRNAKQKHFGNG